MPSKISYKKEEVINATEYLPSISIIMPFQTKTSLKKEVHHNLKIAADNAERELRKKYPADKVKNILYKLRSIISDLDYNTRKRSIAIFLSPILEKIYYLDIPVKEKVIIDQSFEIRDLIINKKEIQEYLVLVLSSKEAKVYLASNTQLIEVNFNESMKSIDYENDIPERVGNFSDLSYRKEVLLNKFLQHIDKGVETLLKVNMLPLFVLGTDRTVGHFKKITHNKKSIIEYIPGNFEKISIPEMQKVLEPYIKGWKKVKQMTLLRQLKDALDEKKLSIGIKNVWKEAVNKKGRLLVVERNYTCPAQQTALKDEIYLELDSSLNYPFYIKDAVDDIIEKILINGGDVEFVDDDLLKDYARIALIEYY